MKLEVTYTKMYDRNAYKVGRLSSNHREREGGAVVSHQVYKRCKLINRQKILVAQEK
jgi:hypothetical protein